MSIELTLIGTLHIDLKGPKRLRRALEVLDPDHLSVEYDATRAQIADRVLEGLSIRPEFFVDAYLGRFPSAHRETLRQYLRSMDFEYWVTKKYAEDAGKHLHLQDTLDLGSAERVLQPDTHAHTTLRELLSENPMKFTKAVKQLYDTAEKWTVTSDEAEQFDQRDTRTREHLEQLRGRVVRIAGIVHTHGAYQNLYERCRDLNPRRMKLCEVDAQGFR